MLWETKVNTLGIVSSLALILGKMTEENVLTTEETAKVINHAVNLVTVELLQATKKFGPFNSHHEGYAVILEELDELWDEVKANNHSLAIGEAIQVAAMALRYIIDMGLLQDWIEPGTYKKKET